MKIFLSFCAVLTAFAFTACQPSGDDADDSAQVTPNGKPLKLLQVATIEGAEAFDEFQRNVQLVQTQRELVLRLKAQLDQTSDPAARNVLQKRYDAALAKLEENNAIMTQTYGFSLTRDYTVLIEKSNLFVALTEQEIANLQVQEIE